MLEFLFFFFFSLFAKPSSSRDDYGVTITHTALSYAKSFISREEVWSCFGASILPTASNSRICDGTLIATAAASGDSRCSQRYWTTVRALWMFRAFVAILSFRSSDSPTRSPRQLSPSSTFDLVTICTTACSKARTRSPLTHPSASSRFGRKVQTHDTSTTAAAGMRDNMQRRTTYLPYILQHHTMAKATAQIGVPTSKTRRLGYYNVEVWAQKQVGQHKRSDRCLLDHKDCFLGEIEGLHILKRSKRSRLVVGEDISG